MAKEDGKTLRENVQQALFQEAIFRPESALVISLALLLAVFAPQLDFLSFIPSWAWLVGGLAAEGALVYSSLSDPEFGRKVVAKLLRREFKPEKLRSKQLQQRMNEALDYRSRIEKAIREQDDSMLKEELDETAVEIDAWLEHIYNLARRIDRYQQEKAILERDEKRSRRRIHELHQDLSRESDPVVRQQISNTLESKEKQIAALDNLNNTIQRAELQLESSHSHLGTIYSQTMLVDVKDIDSGRAKRLRQEISEEVDELQDLILAMDEVYAVQNIAG